MNADDALNALFAAAVEARAKVAPAKAILDEKQAAVDGLQSGYDAALAAYELAKSDRIAAEQKLSDEIARRDGLRRTLRSWKPSLPSLSGSTTRDALRSAECSMKSLLDAMDSADESVSSWKRSEKRLDGLGWQLRTSPEGSGREVRG